MSTYLLLIGAPILLAQSRIFGPFGPFAVVGRVLAVGLLLVVGLTASVSYLNQPVKVSETYLRTDAAAAAAGCASHRGVRDLNPAGFASNGSAVCRDYTPVDLDEHREAPRAAAAIARDEAAQQAHREGVSTWLDRVRQIAGAIAAAWVLLSLGIAAIATVSDRRGGGPHPSTGGHGARP